MADTFLETRLTNVEAQIVAFEDALTTFATTNTQSYTLDTGQTRQTVQRAEVSSLERTLERLYSLRDTLKARLSGSAYVLRPPAGY